MRRHYRRRVLPLLFVMARQPVAGAVKTRLARRIGAVPAACRYRTLLATILRQARDDRRWQLVVAVTPPASRHHRLWKRLAPGCAIIAQSSGDLSRRMASLLAHAGPAPAAVMGSDIENVTALHVTDAWRALKGADAVLCPAEDGGFWLFGVNGIRRRIAPATAGPFEGITWSRSDSGAVTAQRFMAQGYRVAQGPMRRDID